MYAQARGFFARQGIEAELKPFADPSLIPAAVLSGDVQFSAFNVGGLAGIKSARCSGQADRVRAPFIVGGADNGDRRSAGQEDHPSPAT